MLRNKCNKHKTTQNWIAYKSQKNKCTSIKKKNIRNHFSNLCTINGASHKKFWESVKPFLSDKRCPWKRKQFTYGNWLANRDDKESSEIFNDHYMNIIEIITGKKQEESNSVGINTKC